MYVVSYCLIPVVGSVLFDSANVILTPLSVEVLCGLSPCNINYYRIVIFILQVMAKMWSHENFKSVVSPQEFVQVYTKHVHIHVHICVCVCVCVCNKGSFTIIKYPTRRIT
jgi:hypothetical protein